MGSNPTSTALCYLPNVIAERDRRMAASSIRNARIPASLHGFTDLVGACADDTDRDYLRAATRVTDTGAVQLTADHGHNVAGDGAGPATVAVLALRQPRISLGLT